MSRVNPLSREISAKIVYYGPGLSGKTTSLQTIHRTIRPERRGELISLATEGDRTIFFDFLPVNIEKVRSMSVRLQLYTVPGQVFYASTRKLVLNGADGVVFVADSQPEARERNLESMQDLAENLQDFGLDLETFPLVIQYNKRDIPGVMSLEELNADLNPYGAPAIETCATSGAGIITALKEIVRAVVRDLKERRRAARSQPKETEFDEETPDGGLASSLSAAAAAATQAPAPSIVDEPPSFMGDPTGDSDTDQPIIEPPAPSVSPVSASAFDRPGPSFEPLWQEGDPAQLRRVEGLLSEQRWGDAVREAAMVLAELLDQLPGSDRDAGEHAALLGLDGREYLRLSRLASMPIEALTEGDALFALYLLIACQVKLQAV